MNRRTVGVNLLAGLALITTAQVARAQNTSDWPVTDATPQQTRFANVIFGGPPAGVLYTNSVDPKVATYPADIVVSDGLLVFGGGSAISPYTTRIYDADTGQCLFTFPESDEPMHAIGKLGAQTTLFRAVSVPDANFLTRVVTLTAYDLGPILARIPGAEPAATWSSDFTLSDAMVPFLTYMEGALYLGNPGGILKIDGASGTQIWTAYAPASNAAVGDVWVPGAGGPQLERLVITAGFGDNTIRALYDRD